VRYRRAQGDLRPVFDDHGGERRATPTASGTTPTAHQVGGARYGTVPLHGMAQADGGDLLAAAARPLSAVPAGLLTALVPTEVPYTTSGGASIDGRRATRYTTSGAPSDLGVVDPSLAGSLAPPRRPPRSMTRRGSWWPLTRSSRHSRRVPNVGQTPAIVVPR